MLFEQGCGYTYYGYTYCGHVTTAMLTTAILTMSRCASTVLSYPYTPYRCAQCTIWTGKPAPRGAIAATLLQELFSTPSAHPAAEKMEPRHQPPDALTREVAAAGGDAPTA